MYFQITTRCNMTCEHCGFNCTHVGEDMSKETFIKALEMDSYSPSIGGGEPTLHPQFLELMMLAIAASDDGIPFIVTNGSITDTALLLAKLAKKGVITAELSVDEYHDPIDPEVVQAFTVNRKRDIYRSSDVDSRGIRTVTEHINSGRCDFGSDEDCICPDLLVQPNGEIRFCGCQDAPIIGNVNDGELDQDFLSLRADHECWKRARLHCDVEELLARAA